MKPDVRERIISIVHRRDRLSFTLIRKHVSETRTRFCRHFTSYLFNGILTHFPNYFVRKLYLTKVMGVGIGNQTFVHMGCFFNSDVTIGSNSVIGRECHLLGPIRVGNNVSITAQTYVFATSHLKDSPTFEAYAQPVTIEDYAWIGARAMILPGVTIGRGAILGASSTATKNIPNFAVFAGTPAREVGMRSTVLDYELDYSPHFQ